MILISALLVKIIYIFLVCLFGILILGLFVFPIFYSWYLKNNFNKSVYRKIYNFAMYYDFYLINNLPLKAGEDTIAKIDHVLFSNKYIYVIKDRYYDEAISASSKDRVWCSYNSKGEKTEHTNPIMLNNIRCEKFSVIKNIDPSFFVSIVVYNDDAYIESEDELNSFNSFICQKKDLKKLIKMIEKRNVSKFKSDDLDKEVMEIWRETGREF